MTDLELHLIAILAKARFMKRRGESVMTLINEANAILQGRVAYLGANYERRVQYDSALNALIYGI